MEYIIFIAMFIVLLALFVYVIVLSHDNSRPSELALVYGVLFFTANMEVFALTQVGDINGSAPGWTVFSILMVIASTAAFLLAITLKAKEIHAKQQGSQDIEL